MKVCNRCGTFDESKRVEVQSNKYENNSSNGVTYHQVFWFCEGCEEELFTVVIANFVGNHGGEAE